MRCGDLAEGQDHPNAVCKGLPREPDCCQGGSQNVECLHCPNGTVSGESKAKEAKK